MEETSGINWSEVDGRHFEKFVYYLLSYEGEFYERRWFGKGGGDAGRDVTAKTLEKLPLGLAYERKWIFQCKRWAKMPDRGRLFNETASAVRFQPDYWVLVVPLNPSPDMMDYLSALEENYKFKISVIPLAQIEEALYRYPQLKHVLLYGELPNHLQPVEEEIMKYLENIDSKEKGEE